LRIRCREFGGEWRVVVSDTAKANSAKSTNFTLCAEWVLSKAIELFFEPTLKTISLIIFQRMGEFPNSADTLEDKDRIFIFQI